MLREDPNKYGGLGIHMLNAIQSGVITIALNSTLLAPAFDAPEEVMTPEAYTKAMMQQKGARNE